MKWNDLLGRDNLLSRPLLQMLCSVVMDSTGQMEIRIGNGRHDRQVILDIEGDSTHYSLEAGLPNRMMGERQWLKSALLRAGMLQPEWNEGMDALKKFDDIVVGVDTNILCNCIISEHFMDAIAGKQSDSYSNKPNWVLLAIPSTVVLEMENAANSKSCGHLTHAGRMGFRSLQELFQLQRNSSYTGLSVVIVGDDNRSPVPPASVAAHTSVTSTTSATSANLPGQGGRARIMNSCDEPEPSCQEGQIRRIQNGDFLIRKEFKSFLDRINFYKGIFFITSDKTNAMLAEIEGVNALYARHPPRVRKGQKLRQPDRCCVLLSRIIYEVAVEFGCIRLCWNHEKYGSQYVELEGAWLWKDMSNWVRWEIKTASSSSTASRALESCRNWNIPPENLRSEWWEIVEGYMV